MAGGLNAYSYVDGNPVSQVDPLGLKAMPGSETHLTGDQNPEPKIHSPRDSNVKLPGTVEVKDVYPKILLGQQNSNEMSRRDIKDLISDMKKEGYQYDSKN